LAGPALLYEFFEWRERHLVRLECAEFEIIPTSWGFTESLTALQ
jgi:hypothetical protein